MGGHTKWSEIKHKRDRPSVLWTGDNVDAVEKFALDNNFGFTVGSTHGKERFYHRIFERLSYPREDKKVLEIFPERTDKTRLEKLLESKATEDLNGLLVRLEVVLGPSHFDLLDQIRELVDAIEGERNLEYTPWHWTDAKPGDRIYGDGTIRRGSSQANKLSWKTLLSNLRRLRSRDADESRDSRNL